MKSSPSMLNNSGVLEGVSDNLAVLALAMARRPSRSRNILVPSPVRLPHIKSRASVVADWGNSRVVPVLDSDLLPHHLADHACDPFAITVAPGSPTMASFSMISPGSKPAASLGVAFGTSYDGSTRNGDLLVQSLSMAQLQGAITDGDLQAQSFATTNSVNSLTSKVKGPLDGNPSPKQNRVAAHAAHDRIPRAKTSSPSISMLPLNVNNRPFTTASGLARTLPLHSESNHSLTMLQHSGAPWASLISSRQQVP